MKKVLVVLAVLVVACAGALYLIGNHTEGLIKAELAQQPIPGNPGVSVDLTDYHRHLLGADTRFCLRIKPGVIALPPQVAAWSGKFCMLSELHYGPLLFGARGPSLGWARVRTVLDLSALPASARQTVRAVFGDAPPVVSHGLYRFDGSSSEHLVVTPFDYQSQGVRVRLGGLALDGFREKPGAWPIHGYLSLRDFYLEGSNGSVAVDTVDGDSTLSAVVGGSLPVSSGTFAANGFVVSSGGKPLIAGNLTVRARNRVAHGVLGADLGVWMDGLHGQALSVPVDSGYLGFGYHGLDAGAMVQIQTLLRRIGRLQGDISSNQRKDADAVARTTDQVARLRQFAGQVVTLVSQKLLRPGETGASMQLMLDHRDQRQLTLDGRIDYRGLDGKNPAPARFRALGAQGGLQLADVDIHLGMMPELVPPALRYRTVDFVKAGMVVNRDGRLVTDLTVKGGAIAVNGQARTLNELVVGIARLASPESAPRGIMPSAPAVLE